MAVELAQGGAIPRWPPGRPRQSPSCRRCRRLSGWARDLPLVVAGRDLPLAWRSLSTGRGTILLVEDEDGLRALNARGLASRGYTVLEAGNGVGAIDVLQKADGQVDLVVSDVVMPEMDGPTLLRELRNRNPSLKIIFVSGYPRTPSRSIFPSTASSPSCQSRSRSSSSSPP